MFYRSMALPLCVRRIGHSPNAPGIVRRRCGIPHAVACSKATTSLSLLLRSCHRSPCSESTRDSAASPAHGALARSYTRFITIDPAVRMGGPRPLLGMRPLRNTCCAASAASQGQTSRNLVDVAQPNISEPSQPCALPGAYLRC